MQFLVGDRVNTKWAVRHAQSRFSLKRRPLLESGDRIFTIGSCFAAEIRAALNEAGFQVGPDYSQVSLDTQKQHIEFEFDDRPQMNYYNTFSIRQEFERCCGVWTCDKNDFWKNRDRIWTDNGVVFQDPYRREIYAKSPEDLFNITTQLDKIITDAFQSAKLFVVTLGLVEVWRKKNNGLVACKHPGYGKGGRGGGASETEFHYSTYLENLENLRTIAGLVAKNRPDAHVVFTVSPIPLARTFTDNDVFVATTEGKAILRAAVGEVEREMENVTYFPAYEIVHSIGNAFESDDGRHVRRDVVKLILDIFMATHVAQRRQEAS